MLYRLIIPLFFMIHTSANAQIDPHRLDSLARSIDSSAKAIRKYQDSFVKTQENIYREETRKVPVALKPEGKSVRWGQQETFISILTGLVLFTVLIVLLRRKRRRGPL